MRSLLAAAAISAAISAAATLPAAAATAPSPLSVTPYLQHGQVGSRQGWFPGFSLQWTSGVAYGAPVAHQKAVAVLQLDTTQFKDKRGKHQLGLDGGSGTAGSQPFDLYLPAKATGNRVVLRTRPSSGVQATVTGGAHPSLRVTGLPTGTALVTIDVEGRTGKALLHLRACAKGALSEPVKATTTTTLVGGTRETKVSSAGATCPR